MVSKNHSRYTFNGPFSGTSKPPAHVRLHFPIHFLHFSDVLPVPLTSSSSCIYTARSPTYVSFISSPSSLSTSSSQLLKADQSVLSHYPSLSYLTITKHPATTTSCCSSLHTSFSPRQA